jgi:PmbA protein
MKSSGGIGVQGQELCNSLVCEAVRLGADEAEVYYTRSRKLEVVFEKNDLQVPKGDNYEGIGIRVIRNSKQGFASTNILSRESLDDTLRSALAIADASPLDPNHWLPEPAQVTPVPEIYDPQAGNLELREAVSKGKLIIEAARSFDPRVTVDSAVCAVETGTRFIANSKGVELGEDSSYVWCVAMGFAREKEEVSSFDAEYAISCRLGDVDPYAIGRKLAEKVVKSLGATSVPGFRGSVILTPYAGLDLLIEPFVFSINAENVQNGQSQWKGKLGSRVSSPLLSITDDPTLPAQIGSMAFDREGVPTKPLAILEQGILNHYLYNCYTARRDGRESNGHAVGTDQSVPGIGVTNLVVAPGNISLEEMIEGTSRGLVVNRYSGSVDPVSGDFSGVVKGGHYIESGKVVQPVKEVMIAGNIYELLGQIGAVSRETITLGNVSLPYVAMDGCSITGK